MSAGMLTCVGRTEDGRAVVAGVYRAFETYGLPLDVLLGAIRDAGCLPCWRSLYDEARAAGMKHERVLAKMGEAIVDVYGSSFRDVVLGRLEEVDRRAQTRERGV